MLSKNPKKKRTNDRTLIFVFTNEYSLLIPAKIRVCPECRDRFFTWLTGLNDMSDYWSEAALLTIVIETMSLNFGFHFHPLNQDFLFAFTS